MSFKDDVRKAMAITGKSYQWCWHVLSDRRAGIEARARVQGKPVSQVREEVEREGFTMPTDDGKPGPPPGFVMPNGTPTP